MATVTTCTKARAKLATLCDQVTSTREPVIIQRRGHEDVALVAASELRGLKETVHLLSSPDNAKRLLVAINRARGRTPKRESSEALRRELGLEQAE